MAEIISGFCQEPETFKITKAIVNDSYHLAGKLYLVFTDLDKDW